MSHLTICGLGRLAVGVAVIVGLLAGPSLALATGDATSTSCPAEAEASPGFRSFLPDCRAYEMVSPAHKNGAKIVGLTADRLLQASPEGDAITYLVNNPIENDPAGNPEEDRVLSVRGAGGWSSKDISTHREKPTGAANRYPEFFTFSSSLSFATVQPIQPEYQEGSEPLYIRNNATETYEPLVTPSNVAPNDRHAIEEHGPLEALVLGASVDGSHVVFFSPENLTGNAPEGGLFEWSSGSLQLVSVLPNGTPVTADILGGGVESRDVRHAISEDGTRVLWETPSVGEKGERKLYLRDTATGTTVEVDAPEGVAEGPEEHTPEGGWYQTANSSGSEIFFERGKQLTPGSTAGGKNDYDLYVYDTEAPEGHRLTDLTVDDRAGEHADVQGTVLGASEDGSYVYFAAKGVLASGASPATCEEHEPSSTCNLYVAHKTGGVWTTTFIAAVSGADYPDWLTSDAEVGTGQLMRLTARVSPDGNYLAFMSERSLTGYDNVDAISGMPDEEVYLYDASSAKLTCASCNPSGARPRGVYDGGHLIGELQDNWSEHWLAASVPGWSGATGSQAPHQPRYLSNSGRLFFDSPEAYVPQDTNGVEDVYQYEPDGVGGCGSGEGAEGVASYERNGCVALVSGGTGAEESGFADASENGNDVFFVTSQSLVPADTDTNFDMYDAHVCSSESPCPAAPVIVSGPCTTGETCHPGATTTPAFGAPSSTTLGGLGNLVPVAPATKSKQPESAAQIRAAKLKAAIKACKKKRRAKPRASCEAAARKRYGRNAQTKANTKRHDMGGAR